MAADDTSRAMIESVPVTEMMRTDTATRTSMSEKPFALYVVCCPDSTRVKRGRRIEDPRFCVSAEQKQNRDMLYVVCFKVPLTNAGARNKFKARSAKSETNLKFKCSKPQILVLSFCFCHTIYDMPHTIFYESANRWVTVV